MNEGPAGREPQHAVIVPIVSAIIGAVATIVGALIASRTGAINIALSPNAPATVTVAATVTVTAPPNPSASTSPAHPLSTPTVTAASAPPAKPPEFLSNDSAVYANMGAFSAGNGTIKKSVYADSIWGCFDTQTISGTCANNAAYEDYNVTSGYSYFQATVGLSNDSPGDCDAEVQLFGDRVKLFDREIVYGDAIPVRFQVSKYDRLRFQIIPVAGESCTVGLGNAEFTS